MMAIEELSFNSDGMTRQGSIRGAAECWRRFSLAHFFCSLKYSLSSATPPLTHGDDAARHPNSGVRSSQRADGPVRSSSGHLLGGVRAQSRAVEGRRGHHRHA